MTDVLKQGVVRGDQVASEYKVAYGSRFHYDWNIHCSQCWNEGQNACNVHGQDEYYDTVNQTSFLWGSLIFQAGKDGKSLSLQYLFDLCLIFVHVNDCESFTVHFTSHVSFLKGNLSLIAGLDWPSKLRKCATNIPLQCNSWNNACFSHWAVVGPLLQLWISLPTCGSAFFHVLARLPQTLIDEN